MKTEYKLVLVRHGQSTWNLENRFTGWTDVGLSTQGEAEAHRKAAECLQACLALPDHRASEVAQLFGLQRDSAVRERR